MKIHWMHQSLWNFQDQHIVLIVSFRIRSNIFWSGFLYAICNTYLNALQLVLPDQQLAPCLTEAGKFGAFGFIRIYGHTINRLRSGTNVHKNVEYSHRPSLNHPFTNVVTYMSSFGRLCPHTLSLDYIPESSMIFSADRSSPILTVLRRYVSKHSMNNELISYNKLAITNL